MGFVGNLLGMGAGGSGGFGYRASPTNISDPFGNLNTLGLQQQAQSGISQQQNFVNALMAQPGIQNQQNVYNQLAGVANGTGPNPAQAMLNQATGQNVANQASLMAGQRGTGANAGLLARQAAQQGAGIQQNAAGQGASLQANQSLGALGQMGNIAGQQIGQQQNALTGYNQATQSEQQNLLNALAQFNNANVNMQSNMNNANAGIGQSTIGAQSNLVGSVLGGASSLGAAGLLAANRGGMIPQKMAEGGSVASRYLYASAPDSGTSSLGADLRIPSAPADPMMQTFSQNMKQGEDIAKLKKSLNGQSTMPNPGAETPDVGMGMPGAATMGSMAGQLFKQGGKVPGKAEIKGDSLKNDKVPALLSPGEIVIPRSILNSQDPVNKSAQFVQAVLAKNGMRKKA